jgi:hypothetical protein
MMFMENQRIKVQGLCLAAVLAIAPLASATTYDEQVLGDFDGGQLFLLNAGHNYFVGSHGWSALDKYDGVRLTIPAGYQATITFNYSFSNLAPTEKQAWIWDLSSIPESVGCVTTFPYQCVSVPGSELLASEIIQSEAGYISLPPDWSFPELNEVTLSAGTYLLNDNFGFDSLGSETAPGLLSYSIDVLVTEVQAQCPRRHKGKRQRSKSPK